MATHLVTGGSGFVGSSLVRTLAKHGHLVRVIDTIEPSYSLSNVEFFKESILNRSELIQLMTGTDTVHHVAGAVPLIGQWRTFERINIEGTRIVAAAAAASGVSHFNFVSSSAVYGKVESSACPIKESQAPLPFEPYGASKLASENIVLETFSKFTNASCAIIRPRTVVGPGRLGIFELLFNWIHSDRNVYLSGSGQNLMQLIHVDDLAEACMNASIFNRSGVFNVGSNRFGTLREAVGNLCVHAKSNSKVKSLPIGATQALLYFLSKTRLSPLGAWHYGTSHLDFYFDTTKAETELKWNQKHSNDSMLADSYDWYSQNYQSMASAKSVHLSPIKRGMLSLFMR